MKITGLIQQSLASILLLNSQLQAFRNIDSQQYQINFKVCEDECSIQELKNITANVVNLQYQKVKQLQANNDFITLNTLNLQRGFYFVQAIGYDKQDNKIQGQSRPFGIQNPQVSNSNRN